MWDRPARQPWPLDSPTGYGTSKTSSPSKWLLLRGSNPNGEGVLLRGKRLSAPLRRHARHTCDPCFVCERGSYVLSPLRGAVPFTGQRRNNKNICSRKAGTSTT